MAGTAPTPAKIALGEGAVYFNYGEAGQVVAGATRGGSVFNREVEIKEIEFDGNMGPTKGLRRKTRAVPQLTVNSLEIVSTDRLKKFYAGLTVDTTDVSYDKVTATANIVDADYLTNVAFVGETATGEAIVIIVKNALGDGNIELALEDKEEVVAEVQFTGHYTTADIKSEPFEIRFPKGA